MKIITTIIYKVKLLLIIGLCFSLLSCNGQNKTSNYKEDSNLIIPQTNKQKVHRTSVFANFEDQIDNVIRTVFQDSNGNFWFGGEGAVYKFDGDVLSSIDGIMSEDGKGITIKDIAEDKDGKIWFGHTDGISVYDGTSITNYYESDGLLSNDVWCITIDRNNQVWIGTIDGVCKFDGMNFTPFEIPKGKIDPSRGVSSKEIVHHIMEDSNGRILFSTNGGVYIKDGNLLTNLSEKDGLKSGFVNKVLQDKDGSFWICTSDGLYHYVDDVLTNITKDIILSGKGIGTVLQDFEGNIWFNSNLRDIYFYDGASFTKYRINEDEYGPAPFHIYEDKQRRLWFVGYGGAYRYEKNQFINVTRNGPW
ncbi:Two component regulator propeller [Aquimarina amphilecti]|uniref:Two component regulator propeller n=1 Tax=Aquimarina amphilecti TaxID=1038014 RepID=A0A1H7UR94_AQUAM|nr:two-component regulator propeller domain-containing protein [Aquimarina amphilecti]SEL99520.1 Two component regulator propeller [Aquimarina amphilecti]